MKINNIGYLLKEGIRGIFLHGFMSFAAVCVTVACLLIVGSFSSLIYNLSIIVEDLNRTNEVMVYIDTELSLAEAKSLGSQINAIENVQNAKFVTREEALEAFVAEHQNDAAFSGVDATDLRHRYEVILVDNEKMHETVDTIGKITGVAKISAEYELAEGFSTIQNILNIATIAVTAVLLVVSLLIISNTVKLAMYDRKDEIAIMKMVGATNGFIRLPFVIEGFVLGMIGATVAFFAEWGMYNLLLAQIESANSLKFFDLVPFTQIMWPIAGIFALAGLFVGVVGSWTSIRKFMDV
ncbi:MAG: permease-like cell division protein FtsX [Oscillospiraceae bacterium]|nr:permease-like cell division protein FtsX [Oscillospiraceae bacterium]